MEEIPTVSGYGYIISVTTGSGNAVTVQAGNAAGTSNLLAAKSAAASTTTLFQFAANSATSFIQINNASATGATVTAVSVQSVGRGPTGWTIAGPAGIVYKIIGTGTENGIPYIDARFYGTGQGTAPVAINFGSTTAITASVGQTWTLSTYMRLMASVAKAYQENLYLFEEPSASYESVIPTFPNNNSLDTQRQVFTATLANATTTSVYPQIFFWCTAIPIDFTMRIGMPQLEQSSYVTNPIPTFTATVTRTHDNYNQPVGTYFDANGVIQTAAANTPRFDHNPASPYNSLGLLTEVAATNYITSSVPDADINWTYAANNTSSTINAATAPDNTTTATLIADNSTSGSHFATAPTTLSFASGTGYTFSVFAKASSANVLQLVLPASAFTSTTYANFNLSTGTVGSAGAGAQTFIRALGNGWYRCSIQAQVTTATTGLPAVALTNNSTTATSEPSYTGSGQALYIWGAQLENTGTNCASLGNRVQTTSYIPTSGTTATRNADNFTIPATAGGTWYNQSTSTITWSVNHIGNGCNGSIYQGLGASGYNYYFGQDGTARGSTRMFYNSAQACGLDGNPTYTLGINRGSAGLVSGDNPIYRNGSSWVNCGTTTIPPITYMQLGTSWNNEIMRFTYMPTRQPDTSLPDYSRN